MAAILAVDDSASIRQTVKIALTSAGHTVVEAVNGADGLSKAGVAAYDLVITDLNMPIMDGITFIGSARSQAIARFTPILMLTTESQPEMKAKGKAAGATGWLVKPFDPQKLLAVIAKVLP